MKYLSVWKPVKFWLGGYFPRVGGLELSCEAKTVSGGSYLKEGL